VSERLLTAAAVAELLRLRMDPDVEIDAFAFHDVLAFADFGLRDDPVPQHDVPLQRNLERELDLHASVREVETRVISASDHGSSPGVRRRWASACPL
jgi:hypothetical protein